jgi:DNA-binding beta-propeller fold protein YncE
MKKPTGVRVHPETGNIYVCDSGNHQVSVFDEKGIYLFSFNKIGAEGSLRVPLYVDFDLKGNAWITDRWRESLYVFTRTGRFIRKFIPNNDPKYKWQPIAITFDKKGLLYVTDMQLDHTLLIFDTSGRLIRKIGTKDRKSVV